MNHRIVLAGNLDFLSLGDILQLLGSNGSTGILRIKSRYVQDPGLIYMVDGNPANASNGSLTGLEALQSLFGWVEGEFEFSKEPVTEEAVIKKSRMEILLDSLRMLDDGEIEKIGPVSVAKSPDSTDKEEGLPLIKGPLVDYSYVVDEEGFSDGDKITEEGKHGGWIWVVMEGSIDVVKETPLGPLSMLRLGAGAFIGSVASFLRGGSARSATVLAVGDVQVGVLDSQRLFTEYTTVSDEFRGLILSLDKRLKEVSERAVAAYSRQNSIEDFIKDKTPAIKQGENDERILTITQGKASIVRNTDHGDVLLANLEEGDFIGRVPFLNIGHEPHSASVFASEDFEVSAVDPDNLQEQYDRLSATLRNIIEHVAICVSVTTNITCDFHKRLGSKKSD
ncbi:MAG: cyclic nucleotide-binding domain-containing protein [Desulfobacteria bacterium]